MNERAQIKRGQCPACSARGFALSKTQRIECLSCGRQYRLYTEGRGGRLLTAYHLKQRKTFVPIGRWDGTFERYRRSRASDAGSTERISHT